MGEKSMDNDRFKKAWLRADGTIEAHTDENFTYYDDFEICHGESAKEIIAGRARYDARKVEAQSTANRSKWVKEGLSISQAEAMKRFQYGIDEEGDGPIGPPLQDIHGDYFNEIGWKNGSVNRLPFLSTSEKFWPDMMMYFDASSDGPVNTTATKIYKRRHWLTGYRVAQPVPQGQVRGDVIIVKCEHMHNFKSDVVFAECGWKKHVLTDWSVSELKSALTEEYLEEREGDEDDKNEDALGDPMDHKRYCYYMRHYELYN